MESVLRDKINKRDSKIISGLIYQFLMPLLIINFFNNNVPR